MTAFPSGIYSPRTKANKNGVVYEAEKETVGFAEDITKLDDEVVAVETELGANPKGAKANVVTRLDDVDTAIAAKQDELNFGFATSQVTALLQKSVIKTSDETVNNSTTLQDDDELLIAVGANETWIFNVLAFFDSGTIPDIKFSFSGPTGATALWSYIDSGSNVTKAMGEISYRAGGGAGYKRACHIKAVFWIGANAGDIKLRWAQNTGDASNTKVLTGSNIIATRLA